jgi:hypothetical protein
MFASCSENANHHGGGNGRLRRLRSNRTLKKYQPPPRVIGKERKTPIVETQVDQI